MRKPHRVFSFGSLILILIGVLVGYPFAARFPTVQYLVLALLLTGYFAAIRATGDRRRQLIVGVILTLLPVVETVLDLLTDSHLFAQGLITSLIPVSLYTMARIAAFVFRSGPAALDKLYAAVCVYLIAGVSWASVYAELEFRVPGSIKFPVGAENWGDFVYYSFVTLTTLGYGDVCPVSMAARSLAVLEAVFGVVFMATVVARLVGLHTGAPQGDDK